MNQSNPHAALIASYHKLEAQVQAKLAMAVLAASKGPSTAKAKRRRDVVAAKLSRHGIELPN